VFERAAARGSSSTPMKFDDLKVGDTFVFKTPRPDMPHFASQNGLFLKIDHVNCAPRHAALNLAQAKAHIPTCFDDVIVVGIKQ